MKLSEMEKDTFENMVKMGLDRYREHKEHGMTFDEAWKGFHDMTEPSIKAHAFECETFPRSECPFYEYISRMKEGICEIYDEIPPPTDEV